MLKYIILLLSFFFMACQAQKDSDHTPTPQPQPATYYKSALFLKQTINFQGCDANTICAQGLDCAYFDLDKGSQSACVDVSAICDKLGCTQGRCMTLFSYPVQIRCAQ